MCTNMWANTTCTLFPTISYSTIRFPMSISMMTPTSNCKMQSLRVYYHLLSIFIKFSWVKNNVTNNNVYREDYMTWNGPNPELRCGPVVKPEGAEPRRGRDKLSLARGPSSLAKGPAGLAKGSVYQKLNKKSAKM